MRIDTPEAAKELHQPDESADGATVFAFDRDFTIDVNPPREDDKDGVPLEWVGHLAHHTSQFVYATGNQILKNEAKIPGIGEIVEACGNDPGEAETRFQSRPDRRDRVGMLEEIYPGADRYVVVDDIDLSDMDGWDHFFPWEFVEAVENGEFDSLPPSDSESGELQSLLDPQPRDRLRA